MARNGLDDIACLRRRERPPPPPTHLFVRAAEGPISGHDAADLADGLVRLRAATAGALGAT